MNNWLYRPPVKRSFVQLLPMVMGAVIGNSAIGVISFSVISPAEARVALFQHNLAPQDYDYGNMEKDARQRWRVASLTLPEAVVVLKHLMARHRGIFHVVVGSRVSWRPLLWGALAAALAEVIMDLYPKRSPDSSELCRRNTEILVDAMDYVLKRYKNGDDRGSIAQGVADDSALGDAALKTVKKTLTRLWNGVRRRGLSDPVGMSYLFEKAGADSKVLGGQAGYNTRKKIKNGILKAEKAGDDSVEDPHYLFPRGALSGQSPDVLTEMPFVEEWTSPA